MFKKILLSLALTLAVGCGSDFNSKQVEFENVQQTSNKLTVVTNDHNAVFLAKAYLYSLYQNNFMVAGNPLLDTMRARGMDTLLVNAVDTDIYGNFVGVPTGIPGFLAAIKQWENNNPDFQWKVYAVVNGYPGNDGNRLRIDYFSTRDAVAQNSRKFVEPTYPGYLGSTTPGLERQFDGVMLDFEPSGIHVTGCPEGAGDSRRFDCTKKSLDRLRQVIGSMAKVGVAGHKRAPTPTTYPPPTTTDNGYWWNDSEYYYAGVYSDLIVSMSYDTNLYPTCTPGDAYTCNATDYQGYMYIATKRTLEAVSGARWGWDVNHPWPNHNVDVLMGAPAFSDYITDANGNIVHRGNHYTSIENIQNQSIGVQNAITNMTNDISLQLFKGSAVYLHNTGIYCGSSFGRPCTDPLKDRYPNWYAGPTDWQMWNDYWITAVPSWTGNW